MANSNKPACPKCQTGGGPCYCPPTVVPIKSAQQSGANVIKRLEEALEMAKQGKIENCVIVMTGFNGDIIDCWANGNSPYVMSGAIETIKQEFMDAHIERR